MWKRFVPCVGLALTFVVTSLAFAADEDKMVIRRDGFEITLPSRFDVSDETNDNLRLSAGLQNQMDRRSLPWDEGIAIHLVPISKVQGTNPDERAQSVADSLRNNASLHIADEPTIETVKIQGSDAARLIRFRNRDQSQQTRHFDLLAFSGDKLYIVLGTVRAYAGSEILAADGPQAREVATMITTFKLLPASATQPATTQGSR